MAGICMSLTIFLVGMMIFMAKKGGISQEVERFLFFGHGIRVWIQYRLITLGQMGYLIAIGRHIFPLCLLEMAMQYSMVAVLRKYPMLFRLAVILPAVTLVLYWPGVYQWLVAALPWTKAGLYYFSGLWVIGYVLLALVALCGVLAVRSARKAKKSGKCIGCSGGCAGCVKCDKNEEKER